MKNTKRTLTAVTLAICLLMPAAANAASFKDMPASTHWAYQGLQYATSKGYMTGYEDHTLRIANNITRAEAAAMLNRIVGKTAQQKANHFKDMNASNWFYKDMVNLYSLGYISGTSNTTISPNKTITREEAFTILARIAKDRNIQRKGTRLFSDEEQIAPWAKSSIRYLADGYIINGTDGKIYPKNPISRAEFATIIYNLETGGKGRSTTGQETPAEKAQRKKVEEWFREKDRQYWEDQERRKREFEARKKAREEKNNGLYPYRPNTHDALTYSRDERPSDNPKGYEVARVREATTPVPGPAIPENYRVEATQHIDGRTYYGVRLNNVDAYITQEVNRIRVENGLKPLKVLANWDDKSYLRATEANMAMRDYYLSPDYETDKANGAIYTNDEKYNTGHKRPDGTSFGTLFNRLHVSKELGDTDVVFKGENLTWHYSQEASNAEWIAKDIVNGYMNSPAHKANILRENFRFINSGTTMQTNQDGSPINDGSQTDICNCINFG